MKVLFLVNHDVVIYNFRLELIERLLADGHEVYVSSPYGERIDDLIDLGCHYIDTKISRHGTNVFEDLRLLIFYFRLIRKEKPSIVFSYTIKPNIYGALACRLAKTPCVVNITGLGMAVENDGFMQKLTMMLYRISFQRVRRVFFQNEENQQFFADRHIAVDRHALLPGSGVNLDRFSLLPYPSDDTIEFGFISRIMKEKGIDQYLEAAALIKKSYPNTKFHVCGFCEEAYEAKLIQLHNDGIIIYHGMVMDVREIFRVIHCTIHPTYYPEGISNVLLESCACGRPIITTDRAGCREVVEDGVNGYVIEQRNAQDLIKKIERFLALSSDERKQMGLNGRIKVEREFSRNNVIKKYMMEINE